MILDIYSFINLIVFFALWKTIKNYNILTILNYFFSRLERNLIFVKDGNEIIIYDLNNNKLIKNKLDVNIFNIDKKDYDFILLKDSDNIIRYENINEFKNNNCYTKTNRLFLSLKLVIENNSYNINLIKPNFYILNNLLFDYNFIKWYCKNILQIEINLHNDYYILILDKQIKEYKLNKFNSIKIQKDNFEIVNNINILNNIK